MILQDLIYDLVFDDGRLIGDEISEACGLSKRFDEVVVKHSLLAQDLERFRFAQGFSPTAAPRDQVLCDVVGGLKQDRQLPYAGVDCVGIVEVFRLGSTCKTSG